MNKHFVFPNRYNFLDTVNSHVEHIQIRVSESSSLLQEVKEVVAKLINPATVLTSAEWESINAKFSAAHSDEVEASFQWNAWPKS